MPGRTGPGRWLVERRRRQRQRNWAMLVALVLLAMLFFAVTAARFGEKLAGRL